MTVDQWLVRTSDNWIAGPYPAEQVRQMILEGKLSLQDEVCMANHYWIFIHEREEVQQQLGIEVPRVPGHPEDEITETETVAREDLTAGIQPDIRKEELQALSEASSENTAVINTATLREQRPQAKKTVAQTEGSREEKKPEALKTEVKKSEARTEAKKDPKKPPKKDPTPSKAAFSIPRRLTALPQMEVVGGQIERSSFWRGFAWLLVCASGVLVIAIIFILKR